MAEELDRVRAAYGSDPEREWRRLEGGCRARLEYLITMHALERHLPAAGRGAIPSPWPRGATP